MFTGIVEELGHLRSRRQNPQGQTLVFGATLVTEDANLGDLQPGDPVNLERPVRVSDRLGGHIVQGHVDAVGEIVIAAPDLQVRMPKELLRYVVEKGSITVDGCSLTVVKPLADGFTVAVIPHTAAVTTLGAKGPGGRVNLEVDMVAKYVERLLANEAKEERE
jgi:riboflavin synthase